MASFRPLNLSEDSAALDAEEHTRELQIEEAFKIFQKALKLQKDKDFVGANGEYHDLFKLEVISKDGFPLSPTISTLRYLAYRNRGVLVFEEVSTNGHMFDTETLSTKLYSSIEDMVVALDYSEGDSSLIEILYEIFQFFGNKRLTRFAIEYELSKEDEDDDIVVSSSRFVLPHTNKYLAREARLLTNISDEFSLRINSGVFEGLKGKYLDYDDGDEIREKFRFLDPIKSEIIESQKNYANSSKMEIVLRKLTWSSFLFSIQSAINGSSSVKYKSKTTDNYLYSDIPMEQVMFIIPDEESLEESPTGDEIIVLSDEDDVVEVTLENKTRSEEPENNTGELKVNVTEDQPEDQPAETHEKKADEIAVENVKTIEEPNEPGLYDEPIAETQNQMKSDNQNDSHPNSIEMNEHTSQNGHETNSDSIQKSSDNIETMAEAIQKANDAVMEAFGTFERDEKPEQQRSSRRSKPVMRAALSRTDFTDYDRFLDSLNAFLKLTDCGFGDVLSIFLKDEQVSVDGYLGDFISCMTNWTPKHTESFLSTSDDDKDVPLIEILNSTVFNDKEEKVASIDAFPDVLPLKEFIEELNIRKPHISHLRMSILEHLFDDRDGVSLITHSLFQKDMIVMVKSLVSASESYLIDWINTSIEAADFEDLIKKANICVCIYELLADSYIQVKNMLNSLTNRAGTTELRLDERSLVDRIKRWGAMITDIFFILGAAAPYIYTLRYEWCNMFLNQASRSSDNYVLAAKLKRLQEDLANHPNTINVPYANYEQVPRLNDNSVSTQLSKVSILSTFSRLLQSNPFSPEDSEAIKTLESLLIDENFDIFSGDPSMERFFRGASVGLILRFWNILLNYYAVSDDFEKYQNGIEKVLSYLMSQLKDGAYTELPEDQRFERLLKVVGYLGNYIEGYMQTIAIRDWKIISSSTNIASTLENIVIFMSIFICYTLNESAAQISSSRISLKKKSPKSSKKFTDTIANGFSLLFIYFKEALREEDQKPEYINDILSVIHEYLGSKKICGSAGGKFLKMAQDVLFELNWSESEKDISQTISCRYHFNISMDNFIPFDHGTTKIPLDKESVYEIADFVLPICFKKKNPLFNVPKSDLKSLLDGIYEVIGDPDLTDPVVQKNESTMEYYLECFPLNPKNMKESFYGLINLDFVEPKSDSQSIAERGLYYLQGVMALSLYKTRKKAMQGRSVELETVIKMLKQDLVCCSNRVESWMLLGQAYSYLVEDDLIWTSDKINGDKKYTTAVYQRTSLVCYLMGINQLIKCDTKKRLEYKPITGVLMNSFAKELYNAAMSPMSMLSFKVHVIPKFVKKQQGASFEKITELSVKPQTILKVAVQALLIAIQANQEDWTSYYYLSKIQSKFGEDAQLVLESLLKACDISRRISNSADPIVEPHYRLCSLLHKYMKEDKITVEEAVRYLNSDSITQIDIVEPVENKLHFSQAVIQSLKKIAAYDKKKWHHKPRFRMAKIYLEELQDIQKAREEMTSMITVKSQNKNLIQIWKPENERPGKHFIYTFEYISFFLWILSKEEDLISLLALVPRLRRSGSAMVGLYKAWEFCCSAVCNLMRDRIQIHDGYTDGMITYLVYSNFLAISKSIVTSLEENGIPPELESKFCMLSEISEMKRLNNGFGPTAFIDDTYISIYLKIYVYFEKKQQSVPIPLPLPDAEQASVNKTKVAKRDFFPCGSELLSTQRKQIDKLLKTPELFNIRDQQDPVQVESEPKVEDANIEALLNGAKSHNRVERDEFGNKIKAANESMVIEISDSEEPTTELRNDEVLVSINPETDKGTEPVKIAGFNFINAAQIAIQQDAESKFLARPSEMQSYILPPLLLPNIGVAGFSKTEDSVANGIVTSGVENGLNSSHDGTIPPALLSARQNVLPVIVPVTSHESLRDPGVLQYPYIKSEVLNPPDTQPTIIEQGGSILPAMTERDESVKKNIEDINTVMGGLNGVTSFETSVPSEFKSEFPITSEAVSGYISVPPVVDSRESEHQRVSTFNLDNMMKEIQVEKKQEEFAEENIQQLRLSWSEKRKLDREVKNRLQAENFNSGPITSESETMTGVHIDIPVHPIHLVKPTAPVHSTHYISQSYFQGDQQEYSDHLQTMQPSPGQSELQPLLSDSVPPVLGIIKGTSEVIVIESGSDAETDVEIFEDRGSMIPQSDNTFRSSNDDATRDASMLTTSQIPEKNLIPTPSILLVDLSDEESTNRSGTGDGFLGISELPKANPQADLGSESDAHSSSQFAIASEVQIYDENTVEPEVQADSQADAEPPATGRLTRSRGRRSTAPPSVEPSDPEPEKPKRKRAATVKDEARKKPKAPRKPRKTAAKKAAEVTKGESASDTNDIAAFFRLDKESGQIDPSETEASTDSVPPPVTPNDASSDISTVIQNDNGFQMN